MLVFVHAVPRWLETKPLAGSYQLPRDAQDDRRCLRHHDRHFSRSNVITQPKQATLIIRHPDDGKLYVNFDQEILQLIREAKILDRMGIEIPESAKIALFQVSNNAVVLRE